MYERKYGKVSASRQFAEFVNSTYLPWARANKRSSSDDEFHAKVFCRHFGKKSLSEIDQQMIEEFKVKRMKSITRYGRTRRPASVNRELAILSGIFRMAVDYEEIGQNPCRKVDSLPENNQRTRHLSFDEEDRLFAALTGDREYLRTLVTVAIYAGPRRGELLRLRWSNVDFDLNAINFTETKTNKDRSVPMEPIVREALSELHDPAGDAEYVFTNPDTGTRYTDVKKSFSAACREASITDFRFHDLRHTFGTRLSRCRRRCGEDQGADGALINRDNHALHSRHRSREAWGDHCFVGVSTAALSQDCHKRKAADSTTCRNSLM